MTRFAKQTGPASPRIEEQAFNPSDVQQFDLLVGQLQVAMCTLIREGQRANIYGELEQRRTTVQPIID
jgi:hypothetical protein